MVGNLTRYEKKSLSFPNAENTNAWTAGAQVSCSFTPKFVIFYGGSNVNGTILRGVFALVADDSQNGIYEGCMAYKNNSTGNYNHGGCDGYPVDGTNHNAAASKFQFYDGTFMATRVGVNGWWSNTDTYTFEFYG